MLENITLAFYPGAKIGVLGSNGSGKSSLLKIMGGIDDGYTGDARLTPGFTVGYLEQEPKLNIEKDVRGNVMDGAGETVSLLADYEKVLAGWSDPDADYEKLGAQQAELEDKIEAVGGWDLQRMIDIAMEALRLPSPDSGVEHLSGGERRRVALCRLLLSKPDLLLLDEPHKPPRRRVGGMARTTPFGLPGNRGGHHPRSILPRQRGPLDPRA